MKYRKKLVEIEAVQLTENSIFEVTTFIDGKKPNTMSDMAQDKWQDYIRLTRERGYVIIETLEGNMHANFGDYIIRGVKGGLYPCKSDIFHLTYDAV